MNYHLMGIYYTIAAVFLGMQLATGENLAAADTDFIQFNPYFYRF